jgi:hypothetical protein
MILIDTGGHREHIQHGHNTNTGRGISQMETFEWDGETYEASPKFMPA